MSTTLMSDIYFIVKNTCLDFGWLSAPFACLAASFRAPRRRGASFRASRARNSRSSLFSKCTRF